jgi:Cu/Ag efflux protein CusF
MRSWPVCMLVAMPALCGLSNAKAFIGHDAVAIPKTSLQRAQAETPANGIFHGVGIVTAINGENGSLTLDHEEIKGLMPAMEMTYNVKSRDLDLGLKVGDKVGFDLDGKTFLLLRLVVLQRAK